MMNAQSEGLEVNHKYGQHSLNRPVADFLATFSFVKRDMPPPDSIADGDVGPLVQEIGWRAIALGVENAVTASAPDSWFFVRLNDVSLWLPRFTIMTMRHCLRGPAAGPLQLEVETTHWHLMRDELGQGSLFLDIGAATGAMAVPFAMTVPGARIVAFEPSPRALSYLNATATRNHVSFTVLPYALSDRAGTFDFMELPEDATGQSPWLPEGSRLAVRDEAFMEGATRHAVEVRTLDALQDELALEAASNIVIKIDVEGFETEVIAGARETIEKFMPLLFVDIHNFPGRQERTDATVKGLLTPFNYLIEERAHVLIFRPKP
jgi:FkbM family methyltransferase